MRRRDKVTTGGKSKRQTEDKRGDGESPQESSRMLRAGQRHCPGREGHPFLSEQREGVKNSCGCPLKREWRSPHTNLCFPLEAEGEARTGEIAQ